MPIAYACPHCGKQFSVAEQYAGQSGPCAECGQTITVPGTSSPFAPAGQPQASGGSSAIIVTLAALLVVAVMCGGVLIALLLPAVQTARVAARRSQSSNNMKQIALALHNYHDVYGKFPPAVVTDASGKPLYSGRVLLLPFMEQQHLYNQFDLTQPWDSPANQRVSRMKIFPFCDPAETAPMSDRTDYLFVTGPGTVFEQDQFISMADIQDDTSDTIFIVEVKNSGVHWAEPRDLDLGQPTPLPAGHYPGGNIVGYSDGSVRFLPQTLTPAEVRARATRSGGEPAIHY